MREKVLSLTRDRNREETSKLAGHEEMEREMKSKHTEDVNRNKGDADGSDVCTRVAVSLVTLHPTNRKVKIGDQTENSD